MEISPVPQSVSTQNLAPQPQVTGGSKDNTILPQHQAVQPVQKQETENKIDLKAADDHRYRQVKKAAHVFNNVFVVSDKTFTIFKDAKSGQYVTRYTSLRDGKVTYIPEPDILSYMAAHDAAREALVKIEA